jgi:hypothetical protein
MEEIERRYNICLVCPICDQEDGVCNSHLYLNPENNDVSTTPKEGYIKGCGCILENKIKNKTNHCPAKKW